MNIIGISGSLRQGSYNSALLRFAKENAPSGMSIDMVSIQDIPLYNGDLEAQGIPASVMAVHNKLIVANGVLIVSPEYNYSVPGVLKNAIDWLSRVPNQAFDNKAVAIMGASMAGLGTARMQYHLRQAFVYLNADVMRRPEIMVGVAHQKFNEQGELTDEPTQKFVKQFLEAFLGYVKNK